MRFIRNTSFSLKHIIVDDQGHIAAEAEDVIVMYDFNKKEKIRFPDHFRSKAEELEGRKLIRE